MQSRAPAKQTHVTPVSGKKDKAGGTTGLAKPPTKGTPGTSGQSKGKTEPESATATRKRYGNSLRASPIITRSVGTKGATKNGNLKRFEKQGLIKQHKESRFNFGNKLAESSGLFKIRKLRQSAKYL